MTATIKSPFSNAAAEFSDNPAIISSNVMLTYRQYMAAVGAVSKRLNKRKLSRGSHVALLAENSVDYIVALMGIMRAGLVACPISPKLPDGRLKELLISNNISMVVADKQNISIVSVQASLDNIELNKLCMPERDSILPDDGLIQADNPALIIQTSGSSGISKSAVLSFGNLYYNALGSNQNILLAPGDRWLLSLPLYHVGGIGILFRTLLSGAAVLLPPNNLSLIECVTSGFATTHLSLVATQLFRLLRESKNSQALPSLKAILLGGGPASSGLIERTINRGWPLYYSYGLTEMASQVTTSPAIFTDSVRPKTSGKILPYRQLRIDSTGEIEVNGETRFLGYFKDGIIQSEFDHNGWFKTGDIGSLDDTGQLIVTGRIDNQFISGGENIQPEIIEVALCQLLGIEMAVVVPVPNEEFNYRPVAFIKCNADKFDISELKEQLSESLPKFMIPDHFYSWPDKSLHPGLKPDRAYLTKLADTMAKEET